MEQLSRPYQIALGAILVFALAYFLVLKPGGDEPADPAPASAASAPAAPTAPGVAGLGRAVDQANGAAAQSDASARATQDAAAAASGESAPGGVSAPPAGSPSAAPDGDDATPGSGELEPGDASRPILDDVENKKVAVVLFYNAKGADDRAVRRALKDVDRFKGKVRVRQIPIERVADYPAITQGVPVTQAPTLLVLDEEKRARRLVGYQDTTSIQQLVGDVGGSRFQASAAGRYRTRVANICSSFETDSASLLAGVGDLEEALKGDVDGLDEALRKGRALDPPRGFSAFQSSLAAILDDQLTLMRRGLKAERANGSGDRVVRAGLTRLAPVGARFQRLARAKGLEECL